MRVQIMRLNLAALALAALACLLTLTQGCALLKQEPAAPVAPDTVVVKVNGEPIRQSDVDRQVAELVRMAREADPRLTDLDLTRKHAQLVRAAREQLIDQMLIKQAVAKADVKVSEAQVDEKIRELGAELERSGLSLEGLKKSLGVTEASFREMIRSQLVDDVFWQQRLGLKAPTEQALRKIYEENEKVFLTPMAVHLHEVFVPLPEGRRPTRAERNNLRTTAEALRARLTAGEDCAAVARDAAGPKAAREKQGHIPDESDRGWVTPLTPLPKALLKAAFTLKPGQISDVIETEDGFHILKIDEKRAPSVAPFEKVRSQLAVQVARYERDRRIPEELKKMRKAAKIDVLVKP